MSMSVEAAEQPRRSVAGFCGGGSLRDYPARADAGAGLLGRLAGRPAASFDPVLMFKILLIQMADALSGERTEFLINDRLSFMQFLGLGLSDRVSRRAHDRADHEKLTRAGAIEPCSSGSTWRCAKAA